MKEDPVKQAFIVKVTLKQEVLMAVCLCSGEAELQTDSSLPV